MHRSHWDLEVYAKDFQERRMREAARSRLADQAMSREASSRAGNPIDVAIARLLNAWMARFGTASVAAAPRAVAEPKAASDANIVALPYRPKLAGPAQPYAEMVVVARGPLASVKEQPSGVREC